MVIDDDLIRAREEHPFWVMDTGWVSAEDLAPGDCVWMLAGGCQKVVIVRVVLTGAWVYNFTVVTVHT